MSSGPPVPPNPPAAYNFQNQPSADIASMQGITNLSNLNYPLQNYPALSSAVGNITSGAYGAPAIQGAGQQQLQLASEFGPYVASTLGTGFDPQNQRYQAGFQQNVDQTRAAMAPRGIAMTPYGAGLETQSDQAFNLNWQQQQLQRQQQAAQIAASLAGAAGAAGTTGANLLTSAAQTPLAALAALNQGGLQAGTVPQQTIQDWLSYLAGGTGATQAGTSQYSAEAQSALDQQRLTDAGWAGLGQLGGGILGNLMMPGAGSFFTNMFNPGGGGGSAA